MIKRMNQIKRYVKYLVQGSWLRTFFQHEYKARYAHKRLYTVLPKYSKIQALADITSCRLVKDNEQAIELNSPLLSNIPKDAIWM